jgi:plastocyanin
MTNAKTALIRAGALAGCLFVLMSASASNGADPVNIHIGNFAFVPETITVAVGTKVQWVNEDDAPHTVIGVDKDTPIKSPALDTDDKYAVVLGRPGTYKYFCSIHPHMVGVVVVK